MKKVILQRPVLMVLSALVIGLLAGAVGTTAWFAVTQRSSERTLTQSELAAIEVRPISYDWETWGKPARLSGVRLELHNPLSMQVKIKKWAFVCAGKRYFVGDYCYISAKSWKENSVYGFGHVGIYKNGPPFTMAICEATCRVR